MSAKMHYVLVTVLTCAALVGAFFAFAVAASKLFHPTMRWADAHMHPFAAMVVFQMVLPPTVVLGPAFLLSLAMNKWIPARCQKCGNRAYRHRKHGLWESWLGRSPGWISYRCQSCGDIENTCWSVRGG